jgi:hypothetical protein
MNKTCQSMIDPETRLAKSYEEHSNFLVWLKVDPRWASIRSDKRYTELIRKVGLPL